MNFRDNFFHYILILLLVFMASASYARFVVYQDYVVSYEGVCDPTTESCFKGCEDDACTADRYYSKMQKYAPDLYKQCGEDITDCEPANSCLPDERKCSVTYDETNV